MLAVFSPTTTEQVAMYSNGCVHLINFRANIHWLLFKSLSVTSLVFSSDGLFLFIALWDGSLNKVDLNGNIKAVQKNTYHKEMINLIVISGKLSNDGVFVTASSDMVVMWSEITLGKITKMETPHSSVKIHNVSLALPDWVLILFSDGAVFVWDKVGFLDTSIQAEILFSWTYP